MSATISQRRLRVTALCLQCVGVSGDSNFPDYNYQSRQSWQTWARRICGALLIIEGVGGALSSIMLFLVPPASLSGIFGAVGAIWVGVAACRSWPRRPVLIALGASASGVLLAVPVLLIALFSNCGIMGGGCSPSSEIRIFGIPTLVVLLNGLFGLAIWWLTASERPEGDRPSP